MLKVMDGPLKGHKFALKAGLGIGRSRGDIRIDDGKVSSLHAFVAENGDQLVLTDNGSKNGIRFENERVMSLPLKEGTVFQIGNTVFKVILAREKPSPPLPQLPDVPIAPESAVSEWTSTAVPLGSLPAIEPKKELPWNEILAQFCDQVIPELKDQPRAMAALTPAVRLTFLGGVQSETEWVLGYGPRRAGALSVDLPIFEPGAPEVCFEILPSPEGVTFRTNHPNDVTLNGQPIRVKPLVAGDMIVVGATRIEVDLLP